MARVLEPSLMTSAEVVSSYAAVSRTALIHFMLSQLSNDVLPLESPKTVIDVGCGCGDLSVALANKFLNFNVLGVDGSAEMLKVAEQKKQDIGLTNVSFLEKIVGGVSDNEKFDLVFNTFALHHFEDVIEALNTLKNLTKPGGNVIVFDMLREENLEKANYLVTKITDSYFNFNSSASPVPFKNSFSDSLKACLSLDELKSAVDTVFGTQEIKVSTIFNTPNKDDGLNIAMFCVQI